MMSLHAWNDFGNRRYGKAGSYVTEDVEANQKKEKNWFKFCLYHL